VDLVCPEVSQPLGPIHPRVGLSDAIAAYRQLGPTPWPIGPNHPPLTTGHNLDWLSQPESDERGSPARRSRSHRPSRSLGRHREERDWTLMPAAWTVLHLVCVANTTADQAADTGPTDRSHAAMLLGCRIGTVWLGG
jgi:hypothetical protein